MEEFDTTALPENVVSVSKSSKVIQNLYAKRKAEHEKILKTMQQEKEKINMETDEAISSETSKTNTIMEEFTSEINLYLSKIKENLKQLMDATAINSDIIVERIEEAKAKLHETIKQYHDNVNKLEKDRSDKIKLLFKECYEKLSKVSYVSAFELDRMFEENILAVNEITLNKYEFYADEIKDYELYIAKTNRTWNKKIKELKEDLRDIYINLAKKSVAIFHSSFAQELERLTEADLQEEIKILKSVSSSTLKNLSEESLLPIDPADVEKWLKEMQKKLASIDQSAGRIVSQYKSFIIILFNRYFAELEDLKESMSKTRLFDESNINDFQSEIYSPDIAHLNLKIKRDFEKLQNVWQKSIDSMDQSLSEAYNFLKAAAYIWDRHFQRVKNSQILVFHDLGNTIEENNRSTDYYESNMNLLIDKLRQSSNEKNLENNYKGCIALLDDIAAKFTSNHDTEIAVLQKYKSLIEIDIEVLITELNRFLVVHPPDENRDPKKQHKRASQIGEVDIDPNAAYIPSQMLYCIFHADAAKNWMFGLWESVNQYKNAGKEEILAAADEWVKRQVETVKERLSVKLAFHKPRYERLKYSIYNKRKNEINKHSKRFESHKKAAENQIKLFKEKQADDFKQCMIAVENVRTECTKIAQLAQDSHTSHQVQTFTIKLQYYAEKEYKEIEMVGNKCIDSYINFLEKLRISHYLYLRSIRLFSESGNYCSEEVEVLKKNLIKLEDTTKKQLNNLIEKTNVRMKIHRSQIDSFLTDHCQMLHAIGEEHRNNEKAHKILMATRDSILKEIVDIQMDLRNLQKRSLLLVCESIEKVGICEYVTRFSQEFQSIMQSIQALTANIKHPQPIRSLYVPGRHLTTKRSEKLQVQKRNQNKPSMKNIFSSCFEFFPNNENMKNFLAKVINIVANKMSKLEKEGKEFYMKHHQLILDHSKTHQTYTEFIEDKAASCRNLLLQTEFFWNDLVRECISTLKELQLFKERYLSTFTNTCHRSKTDNLNALNECILTEILKEEENTKTNIKEMYDKLRVLYGHPANKKIRDELEKEFEDFMNVNVDAKTEETIKPLKKKLEEAVQQAISEVEQVNVILNMISEDKTLTHIIQELEDQLDHKIRLMVDNPSSVSLQQNTSISTDLAIHYNNFIPDSSNMEKLTSMTQTSLTSKESSKSQADFQKNIDQIKEIYLQNIEQFAEEKLLLHIHNFKEVWANEIRNILNLYKVKYDKKDNL